LRSQAERKGGEGEKNLLTKGRGLGRGHGKEEAGELRKGGAAYSRISREEDDGVGALHFRVGEVPNRTDVMRAF